MSITTNRYTYDQTVGSCEKYHSCGNGDSRNQFHHLNKCRRQCDSEFHPIRSAKCDFEPFVTGSCEAKKPRWSFNSKNGKCGQFYYGGCPEFKDKVDVSQNNFPSKSACYEGI
jgi:hypothetical protein